MCENRRTEPRLGAPPVEKRGRRVQPGKTPRGHDPNVKMCQSGSRKREKRHGRRAQVRWSAVKWPQLVEREGPREAKPGET